MPLQGRIDNFSSYFRKQLQVAARLSSGALAADPHLPLRLAMHRKILYCVILDCLAGIRYHAKNLSNHDRFLNLLRDHTAWPEGELASVPVLRQRLATSPASALIAHLDAKLGLRDPNAGNGEPLSAFDEPLPVLLALSATDDECRHIEQSQHLELVYRYRNFIVHEFREPGYAMEVLADGERDPIYHAYINDHTWRLLYPADFFHRLAEDAVASLQGWFSANSVNPYDALRDSSDWYSR